MTQTTKFESEFRDRCNWRSREKAGWELIFGILLLLVPILIGAWWLS